MFLSKRTQNRKQQHVDKIKEDRILGFRRNHKKMRHKVIEDP
jgi:hypothetical protein